MAYSYIAAGSGEKSISLKLFIGLIIPVSAIGLIVGLAILVIIVRFYYKRWRRRGEYRHIQAGEEQELQVQEQAVQEREQEQEQAVQERERVVQAQEQAVWEREWAVQARERAVQAREWAVQEQERAVQGREQAVEEQERAAEGGENEQ